MSSHSNRFRPRALTALRIRSCAAIVGAAALTACTVGPNYKGAPVVAPNAMHAMAFNRAPQDSTSTAPGVANWWEALDDPELNHLIETALTGSPDIRAARARLQQSRAGLREKQRNLLPKSSGSAAYLHTKLPQTGLGIGSVDLYDVGFDATWEVDLFGGTQRAIEAASAEAAAVDADLADTHVSLSAEVAQTYIDLRDRQQRIALIRESADLEQQILTLTQQRREQGVASDLDVERIRTQVENTKSTLIPLDAQITESLDKLAVLTGREPGALDAELSAAGSLPKLPAVIPVGDPTALMRQRPDIRAAEYRLVSANAQIGEHEADWFPKLTLLGDLGFTADIPSHLLRSSSFTWIGAPVLQWNALDFGRTKAKIDQAKAGFEEAEAKYESTVLGALRDANVALSRYGHQRDNVVSLRVVEESATRAATLTQQRYRAGTSSALDWLDAERTRFSAQQNRIAGDAELIDDYVALQKSLGLGWRAHSNDQT
ncbi:MAG TPA: efflux transporter outer membrane subunit [Steroidobacteraceae bacterium]|nr:efflux transporter outer membrane subunit [Steroidobacteraceae bacterium]